MKYRIFQAEHRTHNPFRFGNMCIYSRTVFARSSLVEQTTPMSLPIVDSVASVSPAAPMWWIMVDRFTLVSGFKVMHETHETDFLFHALIPFCFFF